MIEEYATKSYDYAILRMACCDMARTGTDSRTPGAEQGGNRCGMDSSGDKSYVRRGQWLRCIRSYDLGEFDQKGTVRTKWLALEPTQERARS